MEDSFNGMTFLLNYIKSYPFIQKFMGVNMLTDREVIS
jgi:hypothetical protein